MNTMPLEATTRQLIDTNLKNLGWEFEKGKNQNVWLEQPKTEEERKKLGGKRPDYVLYKKGTDTPLIVIEAKRLGGRIDAALEQGIFYAKQLNAPLVYATDGVFCKSFHTFGNTTPKLNGEDVDEFVREVTALKFLTKWDVNTVNPKVQYDRKELIKIFDEANNMLRGDGLRAGIERFGEFANILFLKLISETEDNKRELGIHTDFDDMCHWDYIKKLKSNSRIEHINKIVYDKLNKLYGTTIFTSLLIKDSDILNDIIKKLDPLTLTDVDSDVKGDAFEYFLKASTASKNDLGEYFTPRHIVKTMVQLVNPQIGEKVYDPFCGTGGFLIEAFRHIYNNMPRNPATEKMLREDTIYGNEITNTARITKMNMILAGDGHSNINMKDSLSNPVDGEFDVVLANMPYSQKTKHGNLYDLPSTNGDSICVQHCMKAVNSASENGRIALVVPEGFLFRKDLTKAREYILENCQLQSIISLPQGVFLPYTGVKTNIIYATKVNQKLKSTDKQKDYWYFDVKSDGKTLDNHRRDLGNGKGDLDKYLEYRKFDKGQKQDMLQVGFEIIPLDKVRKNSFILAGSRYRKQEHISSKYESTILSDVATFIRGISFPKTAQKAGETDNCLGIVTTRAAQSEGIDEKHIAYIDKSYVKDEKLLKKGDILISLANSLNLVGRVTFVNNDYSKLSFGAFMGIIRVDKTKIVPKLLFYILQSNHAKEYFLKNAKTTTNISNLTFEDLKDFSFPFPPPNVQQQIVDELDGYQHIIDGARVIVKNYKPFIPKNVEGETKTLSDIAVFKPPKSEIKALADNTLVSFVPMADMNANNISFKAKELKTISEVYKGFTYFKDNDVLLAKITPCFENGKAGIARNLKNGIGFGSTEYIVIRANTDLVYPEWIYYHINSPEFLTQGKGNMTGTAGQQRIDINFIKNYSIVVPPLGEQRRILDNIHAEQALIEPSKQLIEVFTKKIQDKINELF